MGVQRRAGMVARVVVVLAAALTLVTACTNAPPPPLVPSSTPVTPGLSTNPNEVVIGLDSIAGGYNPHKLADQSAITTALANLMLPSVFRPGPDGNQQLDQNLMLSAEVTKAEPYTVTYRLRGDASWSDSAPIAAEDFVYLWEQLRGAPGVVDPSGYRLITNISARDAGKVVEVTFAKPYPGWRSLFSDLLPAHLLKDAPGGWANALTESFPATAGPFTIKTRDEARGEILLDRNDRYWETPAVADRLVLRRADQSGLVDALRTGHDHVVLAGIDAVGAGQLAALGPQVTVRGVPRPTIATLLLRSGGKDLSNQTVRTAVAALLDRGAVIAAGTAGGPSEKLRADSLVYAPSRTGYAPTLPAGAVPAARDTARAESLLTGAGYVKTSGVWTKDGRTLSLVVGAPADHKAYQAMAEEVQRQLTAAGVQVRLVTPTADQLFTQLSTTPVDMGSGTEPASTESGLDVVLAPQPAGGDPATILAAAYGCPSVTDPDAATLPSNLTGFCDTSIQPGLEAALTGTMPLADALGPIESRLWQQLVAIPLYQEADLLAVRPEMSGVEVGPPLAGPFRGAPDWRRSGG